MRGWFLILALGVSTSVVAPILRAEETPSLEATAASAQACVATVRVLDAASKTVESAQPRVTVCTGVCIEKGWVVAPAFAGSDSQIRLTMPGGQQSSAQLRVIDEYSGLALLEADTKELTPAKLAKETPQIGAWMLSAAAWGVEQPVVSFGILSARDRTAGGMQYPPLLQVDLKTTETSSGAALVNRAGELTGIIVLVDEGQDRRGFTFAVPSAHVQRLLRARIERPALDKPMPAQPRETTNTSDHRLADVPTNLVILKRRRPVVGMELGGVGESVVIQRITKGSPAEKAGLQVGDVVQAVDGMNIRSAYQGVRPVLFKQPGDVVTYRVQQGVLIRDVEITLGGGIELPSAPAEKLGEYIRPKVDIEATGTGSYVSRGGLRNEVRELLAPQSDVRPGQEQDATVSPAEKIKLLEKALDSYRAVIAQQQSQLTKYDADRKATQQRLEQLEAQLRQVQAESQSAK